MVNPTAPRPTPGTYPGGGFPKSVRGAVYAIEVHLAAPYPEIQRRALPHAPRPRAERPTAGSHFGSPSSPLAPSLPKTAGKIKSPSEHNGSVGVVCVASWPGRRALRLGMSDSDSDSDSEGFLAQIGRASRSNRKRKMVERKELREEDAMIKRIEKGLVKRKRAQKAVQKSRDKLEEQEKKSKAQRALAERNSMEEDRIQQSGLREHSAFAGEFWFASEEVLSAPAQPIPAASFFPYPRNAVDPKGVLSSGDIARLCSEPSEAARGKLRGWVQSCHDLVGEGGAGFSRGRGSGRIQAASHVMLQLLAYPRPELVRVKIAVLRALKSMIYAWSDRGGDGDKRNGDSNGDSAAAGPLLKISNFTAALASCGMRAADQKRAGVHNRAASDNADSPEILDAVCSSVEVVLRVLAAQLSASRAPQPDADMDACLCACLSLRLDTACAHFAHSVDQVIGQLVSASRADRTAQLVRLFLGASSRAESHLRLLSIPGAAATALCSRVAFECLRRLVDGGDKWLDGSGEREPKTGEVAKLLERDPIVRSFLEARQDDLQDAARRAHSRIGAYGSVEDATGAAGGNPADSAWNAFFNRIYYAIALSHQFMIASDDAHSGDKNPAVNRIRTFWKRCKDRVNQSKALMMQRIKNPFVKRLGFLLDTLMALQAHTNLVSLSDDEDEGLND